MSTPLAVTLREAPVKTRRGASSLMLLNIDIIRNVIFAYVVIRYTRKLYRQLRGRGFFGTAAECYIYLRRTLFTMFFRLPGIRDKIQAQIAESRLKMEKQLIPSGMERNLRLPAEGWGNEKVRTELKKLADMNHTRWEDGRVSGAVYHGGKELGELQTEAFGLFTVSNPIHPDVFPGVRKMEAEVVAMVLSLFHAPEGAAGVTTSGGTESILMACLSAKQKGYHERGIREPEMILPSTAHAAFLKAGEYFGIKIHLVACPSPSYRVDIAAVRRLINPNTILLVGSAPNYPHGVIDDISTLSKLAHKNKIPLHVDCCLGSFLVPLLDKAGFPSEPMDFKLKGVTSVSCDTHKYGFAPKGSSTVLYRTESLRRYQYFVTPEWPGGVYGSPSMAGSRPGALIAGCWASMMAMGEAGYIDACHKIVGCARDIETAIREDDALSVDLRVVGKPMVSVVAFSSPTIDIYAVADGMSAKGWHLNSLQNPAAVHVAVTLPIVAVWPELIKDLKEVVTSINEQEKKDAEAGVDTRSKKRGTSGALYGVAATLPSKVVVEELVMGFLDTLYKV